MNILALNCGSATIKFQIIETDRDRIAADSDRCLASGVIEHIGEAARIVFKAEGRPRQSYTEPLADYRAGIDRILAWVTSDGAVMGIRSLNDIHAVGHRVVHGGERFRDHALIDQAVLRGIEDCVELAPLHNPVNLKGIHAAAELLGGATPQVAVFDTAFHMTMPEASYLYGLPYELYEKHGIRRYGFHGTSHQYLAYRYGLMRGLAREAVNIITLHLGGGCSACAIREGRSFVTSMGFTPLAGLLMGTRSGDIDPSLIAYLAGKEDLGIAQIERLLNKQSGLLGVSGLSGDMRELLRAAAEDGNRRADLAIELFCRRVRHYIGAYLAEMDGAEALVFSGGIGENAPEVRRRICQGLSWCGVVLDEARNEAMTGGALGEITTDESHLKVFVVPTNEELLIARETAAIVE
jgi:acetate kinase